MSGRTLILFALGLFINTFPIFHFSTIRIPGVLQRIALCYFFASAIVLRYGIRGRIIWLVSSFDRLLADDALYSSAGNRGRCARTRPKFRRMGGLLCFSAGTCGLTTKPGTRRGLSVRSPAVGTTLFGVLTGELLKADIAGWKKNGRPWSRRGVLLIAVGKLLDPWLPINKSLWTSTFAIFMAGIALVAFAFFYWSIDILGAEGWAKPLVIFGVNPIAIYFLSEVLDHLPAVHSPVPAQCLRRLRRQLPVVRVPQLLRAGGSAGTGVVSLRPGVSGVDVCYCLGDVEMASLY